MAGRIKDEDVKAVRDAVPIDAVVSEYLQLKNAGGGNLKGLCPFHDEKSPSFQVSPSKGLYHCFGCGEGGDTLAFVMKVDHLTFAETVERLAQRGRASRCGTRRAATAPPGSSRASASGWSRRTRRPRRSTSSSSAPPRPRSAGSSSPSAASTRPRPSTSASATRPAGWDHLVRFLRGKGFTDKELIVSGLASEGRRGGAIDRFRGRLIWPIRDITGEVIGFGARKLREDDQGPKYLNTPETPLYKKSQVLYGIDLAKKEIASTGRAVVVEGYTDVMACHLAGVTTAIATCGTAFGGEHIKILRRLLMDNSRSEVVFTFDGDAAGQKAALRAFEDDQKFAAQTSIAVTPDGMDPCELRLAKGDSAVEQVVEGRTPLFEFAHPVGRRAVRLAVPGGPVGRPRGDRADRGPDQGPGDPAQVRGHALRAARLVTDTQFVVRRVSQLARWEHDRRRDRGRGRGGPPGPTPRGTAAGRRRRRCPRRAAARPAAPGWTCAAPPTASSANCSSSPSSSPSWSPRRSTPTARTSSPARRTPRCAAPSREAGGAERRRRATTCCGSARPRPTTWCAAMVTELAVEPVMHKVPEIYAGEVLVRVRLLAVDRRVAQVHGAVARLAAQGVPAESPRPRRPHRRAVGPPAVRPALRVQGAAAL